MMLHIPRPAIAIVLLALTAAGCGTAASGDDDGTAGDLRARLAAGTLVNGERCPAAGRSRWAAAGAGYRATATYGDDEDEALVSVAGVAVRGGSVFVYDGVGARVAVLAEDLRPRGSFARQGEGPGELARSRDRSRAMSVGRWRWIDAAGDGTIFVFDGRQAHRFGADGAFRERVAVPPPAGIPVLGGYPRIRAVDSALYVASALVMNDSGKPQRWAVHRLRGAGLEPLLELTLAALPRWTNGSAFRGPAQARPLWEVAAGCIVATDGEHPWLVRRPLAGGAADSLPVALPDRDPPKMDERTYLRELNSGPGPNVRSLPGPTAVRRVLDVIADPDGHLWILPLQPRGGGRRPVEVLRVDVGTGASETDTVPAFPLAFGAPGVYYAAATDADGVVSVVRYERGREPR